MAYSKIIRFFSACILFACVHISAGKLDLNDDTTRGKNQQVKENIVATLGWRHYDVEPYVNKETKINLAEYYNSSKYTANNSDAGELYYMEMSKLMKSVVHFAEEYYEVLNTNLPETLDSIENRLLDNDPQYSSARGKKIKNKKMLMYLILGMKVLNFGLILPTIIGLTILAAWKGITISLLAFMLASIIGIKSLFNKPNDVSSSHHHPTTIVVTKFPYHLSNDWARSSDDLPFRSYFH